MTDANTDTTETIGALVSRATAVRASDAERSRVFGQIVARFQDMAYGCAYAMLGDRHLAEDAAQEAFLTAWREIENLREPDAFPGWFQRIVRTQCSRLTRNKRLPTLAWEEVSAFAAVPCVGRDKDPHVFVERRELTAHVRQALAALPEHERLATTLYYIGEYGQGEIAAFLGVPVTTIKKRLFSARQRLRERIAPYMPPEQETTLRTALQAERPSRDAAFARAVALWSAVERSDADAASALLADAPAELVGLTDQAGATPLHRAAGTGYIALVERLLNAGADPNARRSSDGVTPLHCVARESARVEVAEMLLAAGANIDAHDDADRTPLHIAAVRSCPAAEAEADCWGFAEYLLRRGAALDLHTAAAMDRADGIARIVEKDSASVNRPSADGDTPLHIAARAGYRKATRALLEAGADVNAVDGEGRTPLHVAAQPGRTRLLPPNTTAVNLLKEKGAADVDIFAAALLGDVTRIEELLAENPALLNARDETGATPLCLAAWTGHRGAVEHLLERGADGNAKDKQGRPALTVRYRPVDLDSEITGLLLAAGVKPDIRVALALSRTDDVQRLLTGSPKLVDADLLDWAIGNGIDRKTTTLLAERVSPLSLHHAAALGMTEKAAELLAAEPELARSRDARRNTPLHCAAAAGNHEIAVPLLRQGADANAVSSDGATPLHRAAQSKCEPLVDLLLKNGANAAAPNYQSRSPLFYAAEAGDAASVTLLIGKAAAINEAGAGKATPLHIAAEKGQGEVVALLLKAGADVAAKNHWGGTALHLAAREGHAEVARLLLEAEADRTARDDWHRTPLHTTAWFGRAEVAALLLEVGVSVHELSFGYSTPLHTAAERGSRNVAELLIRHGADVNARSDFGRTPLHDAVHGDQYDMACFLIENGADVNVANNRCMTPLHWAAAGGKTEVVCLLLERGARVDVHSHKNETPLDLARRHKCPEIVALLETAAPVRVVD